MQVRVTPVRNWFTRGGTQKMSLFLHHQPPGFHKPEAFRVAGCGGRELINILEKIVVAQAINSALSRVRGSTAVPVPENC
jgi:hypothetical protein